MRFLIFYAIIFLNSFSFVRALIAQSVEHGANNARVAGSSPAESIFYVFFSVCDCDDLLFFVL